MAANKSLLTLLRTRQFDDALNMIRKPEADVNVSDTFGMYPVHYAVALQRLDVFRALLERDAPLNVLDPNGRTVMYDIVRLHMLDFLDLVMERDVSALNAADADGRTALHYAVITHNEEALHRMLDKAHVHARDEDDNTVLHHAITYRNSPETILRLLDAGVSPNAQNAEGNTPLHIAVMIDYVDAFLLLLPVTNPNVQTFEAHLSPLFMAVIYNNKRFIDALMGDPRTSLLLQDMFGNTILHYCIRLERTDVFAAVLARDSRVATYQNSAGDSVLHVLLKGDFDEERLKAYDFAQLLRTGHMNQQDNEGNTVWLLLARKDLWPPYVDILVSKKNAVFVTNDAGEHAYGTVQKLHPARMPVFLRLLKDSYAYKLVKGSRRFKHADDQKCSAALMVAAKYGKKAAKCEAMIERNIAAGRSFPEKQPYYCVEYKDAAKITAPYTGISLDIVASLLWLTEHYPQCTTSLTPQFDENSALHTQVKKASKTDFNNYEMVWANQQLLAPSNMILTLERFVRVPDYTTLVIPLGIQLTDIAHSNMLILTSSTREIERFEPFGRDTPPTFYYFPEDLDRELERFFAKTLKGWRYVRPNDYLPKLGPQLLENIENKDRALMDPQGYCSVWSLWYADMRLRYAHLPRDMICIKVLARLRGIVPSLRRYIRSYANDIATYRDKLLDGCGVTIDAWFHDEITNKDFECVKRKIIEKVKVRLI